MSNKVCTSILEIFLLWNKIDHYAHLLILFNLLKTSYKFITFISPNLEPWAKSYEKYIFGKKWNHLIFIQTYFTTCILCRVHKIPAMFSKRRVMMFIRMFRINFNVHMWVGMNVRTTANVLMCVQFWWCRYVYYGLVLFVVKGKVQSNTKPKFKYVNINIK